MLFLSPKFRSWLGAWPMVTYQDALANVEVIIEQWVATAKEIGRPIPKPRGRLMYA